MHVQVTAMTNGTAEIANGILEKAGVRQLVDAVMDVSQCSAWKPAPEAYHFAVAQPGFGFKPEEVGIAIEVSSCRHLAELKIDVILSPHPFRNASDSCRAEERHLR